MPTALAILTAAAARINTDKGIWLRNCVAIRQTTSNRQLRGYNGVVRNSNPSHRTVPNCSLVLLPAALGTMRCIGRW